MKKIYLNLIILTLSLTIFGQAPEALKYQAVVRNSSGELVKSTTVAFKLSILQTTETGTKVYAETQNVSTNEYGLATLNIGKGVTTDVFGAINWGADKHFLKIEVDIAGGTAYQHIGTS